MPALEAGVRGPEINLADLEGHKFALHEALKKGPVVAAFFKVSCPVCQFTFPYLEKIFKAHGKSGNISFVAISQDRVTETKAFNKEYGITFLTLLDEPGKYLASNGYRLTNVPSIFLISRDSEIEMSIVGWSRKDMENLNVRLATLSGSAPAQLFRSGENVPEYKPG
jgi:peroxiredoxin